MKINYNITGDRRKSFVGALSNRLNLPVRYLGMPSANYEVGAYCISKTGLLEGPDDRELVAQLREDGFEPVSVEYDSEEILEMQEAQDTPEAPHDKSERLSIEMPLSGFTPEKLDNLAKIVTAKSALLKMALGAEDLPIRQTGEDGGKLCFPWFEPSSDADHVKAYVTLIERLCTTAKEKKRVTSKEKDIKGSPKYAFRVFLLSLGFIGDGYKSARKILLSKMHGNSSRRETTVDDISE